MPWKSEAQQRWGNSPAGERALGAEGVEEWNAASKGGPRLPSYVRRALDHGRISQGAVERVARAKPSKKRKARRLYSRGLLNERRTSSVAKPYMMDEGGRADHGAIPSNELNASQQQNHANYHGATSGNRDRVGQPRRDHVDIEQGAGYPGDRSAPYQEPTHHTNADYYGWRARRSDGGAGRGKLDSSWYGAPSRSTKQNDFDASSR